jgi:ABC-type lipoprotein export system ATPase subunit
MEPFIRLENIVKTYENNEIEPVRVLRGINLDIQK